VWKGPESFQTRGFYSVCLKGTSLCGGRDTGWGGALEFKFLLHVTLSKTLIPVFGQMRDRIIFLAFPKEVFFCCVPEQLKLNNETF
jgi:hypothetical protein